MAFDDCDLVRGDMKDLELQNGKDRAWHYWVEHNDWCYEPWDLLKYKKDLYYKMFKPTNTSKKSRKELEQDSLFRQNLNGHYVRAFLPCTIPLLESIARQQNSAGFIAEIEKFKKQTDYNPQAIMQEMEAGTVETGCSLQDNNDDFAPVTAYL